MDKIGGVRYTINVTEAATLVFPALSLMDAVNTGEPPVRGLPAGTVYVAPVAVLVNRLAIDAPSRETVRVLVLMPEPGVGSE